MSSPEATFGPTHGGLVHIMDWSTSSSPPATFGPTHGGLVHIIQPAGHIWSNTWWTGPHHPREHQECDIWNYMLSKFYLYCLTLLLLGLVYVVHASNFSWEHITHFSKMYDMIYICYLFFIIDNSIVHW